MTEKKNRAPSITNSQTTRTETKITSWGELRMGGRRPRRKRCREKERRETAERSGSSRESWNLERSRSWRRHIYRYVRTHIHDIYDRYVGRVATATPSPPSSYFLQLFAGNTAPTLTSAFIFRILSNFAYMIPKEILHENLFLPFT